MQRTNSPYPDKWTKPLVCVYSEGAFWARGRFWLARGSPYNPSIRRVPLLSRYDDAGPAPPSPEVINRLVSTLALSISKTDALDFAVQAAILRATAREYYAS